MAKNLKVQIKNAQLAEALQLGKPKKKGEPASKEKAEEKAPPPAPPMPKEMAPPPPAPPPEEKKLKEERVVASPPTPSEAPPPPRHPSSFSGQPILVRAAPTTPTEERPPRQDREPYQERERPPRQDRERTGGGPPRRPFTPGGPRREGGPPGSRPPFQRREGSGPPFQRREGGTPYQRREGSGPPGSRPPFQRRESGGPPFQRREGGPPRNRPPRPFTPGGRPSDRGAPRIAEPKPIPSSREVRPPRKATTFKDFQDLKPQRKTDLERGFDSRDRMGLRQGEDEEWRKKRGAKGKKFQQEDLTIRPKALHIRLPILIKDLAVEMKLKASQIISKLFMQGTIVTINDFLDDETTIQLLGHEFGCEISIDTSEEKRIAVTDKTIKEEISQTDLNHLILRPPVVTFMGHVDHGKTTLIDAIRKTNVAAGEAGAITQHIGAFKCHSAVGDITILDTPGHEAFSAMRERGADVTDLVVLVVAGDEGIREQTVEAINQAKTAGVPIMVAINKSDKPGFNPENVYRQLAEQELLPEVWGGNTITCNCSAVTGAGIKELLEMLSLQSEILELRANPVARARGNVIESEMHLGMGAVATLLVQNGTLRLGDSLVFDMYYARVKTMQDEHGHALKEAGPSTPVKITGLSGLPEAGSQFVVVQSEREAREIAHAREEQMKHKLQTKEKRALEGFLEKRAESQKKKVLNVILRADVQGSLEALKQSLQKIHSQKAELYFVSEGIGQISESDIELAAASHSLILGFHTKVESHAETLIKQKKVPIKIHEIIYHAVDEVRNAMRALLDKIPQENEMGEAMVKAVFKSSQLGLIAGCQVTEGLIKRNHHVRLLREDQVIWKGSIASLKRVKEDVREVSKGLECGIVLQNYSDIKEGDKIQAYEITYLEQEL